MQDIKEKPVMDKLQARDKSALLPKQAGRMMREKYLRRLEQHSAGTEEERESAPEQVESGGRWAVDEAVHAVHAPRQKQRLSKEKAKTAGATAPPAETPTTPRSTAGGQPHPERTTRAPKGRETPIIKEHTASATTPGHPPTGTVDKPQAASRSTRSQYAQRQFTLSNRRRGSATFHQPPARTGVQSVQGVPLAPGHENRPLKSRPTAAAVTPKTRTGRPAPVRGRPAPKMRCTSVKAAAGQPIRAAKAATRQTAQRHMTRQMVAKAQKTAKATAAIVKRVAQIVVKAAAALVGAVVGIAGGGILLVALVIVVVIAAVANSPFGLFFAEERNAPYTVSVAEAVFAVNIDYNAKLEELQSGDYDSIVIVGQAPDWPDVLAVFAVKLAGADADGVDVATLDVDRVEKLKAVFWDMTAITSYVETIDHPGSGEDDPGWTEYILHITITPKTADDMRAVYAFTNYQNSALDELLADRAALSSLAGSLTITNADVSAVLDALPADLDPERREAVRTALTLVGKVGYFWGGKSYAIGWDSRWGTLQKVWADGSSTTGTYRPYGLDCSGFVDWIFNNSMGYVIGHGGGVIMQHTYCTDIPWSEAQPGDLAFFPGDSHIGIVVGRSADGGILVCHCSSGQNNVVVTDCAATGFTAIGRPDVFS